ncbi:Alg9-like mannosyltransferase [Diplocarpon rosae]|nr:Alg9-like mannosyltransferase [Diplocarpon rosae]
MKLVDALLIPVFPIIILLHLLVAPYTKVEESFNIQATHDLLKYGAPSTASQTAAFLQESYDHFSFPGAVPRTSVGARALAACSAPLISYLGQEYAQLVVRATLGLFNAFALYKYASGLGAAYGRDVGRWYIALQASQFHVIFYASRTLPNMFAFGITTFAFNAFLPSPSKAICGKQNMARLGITLFVFAGVVFRAEIALLLATQLLYLLAQSKITLKTIILQGLVAGSVSLIITVALDGSFWQKKMPFWPEWEGFYFNAIQGKSTDWGTSPFAYYFTNSLPRLLVNPFIPLLCLLALALPSTRYPAQGLTIPALLFVAIYSVQPHKESRFIIYVVPPLTAAASLGASYIWTRRSKSWIYSLASLMVAASVAVSFLSSTIMLLISSLNYPGGDALNQLHDYIGRQTSLSSEPDGPANTTINIHMDVLSCMTGVTRFQQRSEYSPYVYLSYDKTENDSQLLEPEFWARFDYALMEEPGKAIGKWEVVSTVFAYAGIEFLRAGDGSSFSESLERVYAANNLTKPGESEAMSSEEVKDEVERHVGEAEKVEWDEEKAREVRELEDLKVRLLSEEMGRFGTFRLIRDAVRVLTGGYWIGPKMEPRIRILKRVKE